MKKLCLILALSTALLNICFAQSSVWKVEGKGNTVYIGGTMHLLTPEDYPLPLEFDSAYFLSDALVLEADLKKMEDPAIIQTLMLRAMYQDDRTLESELSKEVYALLESKCAELDITLSTMSKFKPSMVVLIYTVTKMQQSGSISAGVDQYYLSKALEDDKTLLFLETVESQLDLLFGEDEEIDDESILQFFDDQEKTEKMSEDIKAGWQSGKSKIFVRIQKEMSKNYPEVYKKLIVNRNNNWISEIDAYFDSEPVEFVLFGALHLHGSDGILEMLKQRGYHISQL